MAKKTHPTQKSCYGFRNYLEYQSPKAFEEIVLEIMRTCGRITPEVVASDRKILLKAYSRLRASEEQLPLPCKLNEKWAIFRRLQVELVAADEYMYSFRDGQFHLREAKKAHDQVDFRVLIAACLAGGVATRDSLVKRYFNILCPKGVLHWLG